MNKLFNLFNSESLQERRFKAEYDLLRIKFISDHYLELENPEAKVLTFIPDSLEKISNYSKLCRNVVNLLNPENRDAKKLDTDSKFKISNAARREEIMDYDNYECDTRVKQIIIEASKIDAWRKEAILQLFNR